MRHSSLSLLATAALSLLALIPAAKVLADEKPALPMSIEEFKLYRKYQDALGDPRIQKMEKAKRIPAIAKSLKTPDKKLRSAVEAGETHADKMGPMAEEAIRKALVGTPFEARIKRVKVDAVAARVIAYVTWLPDAPEAYEREACLAAARVVGASPLVDDVKVEILRPGADLEVAPPAEPDFLFDAVITASSASRIDESKIVDFAKTRYLKLFEKVKVKE